MIVFISNYLNHHQISICQQLALKDKFYFIASEPTPSARMKLGYEDMNNQYDFVIKLYESSKNIEYAQILLNNADIVIAGSCCFPFEMLKTRLQQNKLTFWFSERIFKRSFWERFYPPKALRILKQCTKYRDKNFYLLCAGGYVAQDYSFYNAFRGKSFNWGYFPHVNKCENNIQKEKFGKLNIMWTARYLKWKHPEYAIYAAKILKNNGINFKLEMMGIGKYYNKISNLIKKNQLEDCVYQLGAVPAQQVRSYMDSADIFIFTSDRHEGWGAVLNESMNSKCAVIANENIGSVKSIIQNGFNGITYKDKKQFGNELLSLSKDIDKQLFLGKNAFDTIEQFWSSECAVNRFYETAMAIINGEEIPDYDVGPMKKIN